MGDGDRPRHGPAGGGGPGFLDLADAALYGPAALGRRERELLDVATSEANGADYSCLLYTSDAADEL